MKILSTLIMKKSLRTKVLMLVSGAVVIPTIIVTIAIVSVSKKSLWNSIKSEQKQIATRVADNINSYIQHCKTLIKSVSDRDYSRLNKAQIRQIFSNIMELNTGIMEISLIDSSGMELTKVTRTVSEKPKRVEKFLYDNFLTNRQKRPEFQIAMKKGYYISPTHFSGARIPFILISCASRKNVILAKLDLSSIWEIISKTKVGKTGYAFVVDKEGVLVAHPDSLRVIAHTTYRNFKIVEDFLSNKKDTFRRYTDETGKKVISFFDVVPEVNWGVFTCLPYREVNEPVKKMLFRTITLSGILCIVFLFLGLKFTTALLNPVSQLRDAVKKISAGKFDVNLKVDSGDEIQELAESFNSMAKALRELEQIRQDLISMIVHDMKSPLSGIIGSLDYLLRADKSITEQKEILSITRKSVESLSSLIQNLLDVSKIEEGKLKLNYELVDLKPFLEELSSQFELSAISENKKFKLNISDNVNKIRVDKNLFVRVLNNLLYNSLQHTTSNGKIWLNVSSNSDSVEFEVGDNGVGIPEEYKTRIFEKFTQVERKRAHLRTGTGLGLTFCKMVIELHGGKIWVESEENRGSAFKFVLPA